MAYTTLISADVLAASNGRPDLVVLDARFSLDDEKWGARTYLEGHILGAHQADLAEHMSGPIVEGVTGRRPFPDPERFAAQLGNWGIGPSTQVVTYDNEGGLMAASRLWLMLRWLGHDNVAVLDGGYAAWLAFGNSARLLDKTCVFDSRGAEGYHGGGKYYDPVRGHIAGAGLADRAETMAPDGRFRDVVELRHHFTSLIGEQESSSVIFYCGSGVTAAQNVLAMTHAGLPGSRMYVGSWSEWITDPNRPVEL